MTEISHVRLMVPEQATLNRILREGGAQQFPQWLYAEPGGGHAPAVVGRARGPQHGHGAGR